jgi:hypothetical protein
MHDAELRRSVMLPVNLSVDLTLLRRTALHETGDKG